ncbi:helix-turn-helix domain-containing protein [Microvirga tunisiensis]
MEERRLTAATLLRQGQLSQADIARHVGVSRASVCRWAATLAQEGRVVWKRAPSQGRLPASMRRPGRGWAGCWIGVRWRPALPPNGGRLSASPP